MRTWLITPFEPIPTETGSRPMRGGLLAAELASRGHEVVWWTPDFEHFTKVHRTGANVTIPVSPNYEVRLLKSLGFSNHVSLRRLRHNRLLAERWRGHAEAGPTPELIVCAWPTPDLARESVCYGEEHGVPVVVDIRDLWPDLWLEILPSILRPGGRLVLGRYYRMARKALSGATAITGVTDEYIDWAVKHAHRERRDSDRAFRFEFQRASPTPAEVEAAESRLTKLGWRDDGRLQAVFAGTFGRSFEFDTIREAARRLDAEVPGRCRILLCGSGDRWVEVFEAARGIDSLQVLPRLSLVELQHVYEHADYGLAPYRNIDNFRKNIPNKIGEYLTMGLPILSGVDGRIAELIESEGVGRRYEAGNPESLARLLRALLEDPEETARLRQRVDGHAGLGLETEGTAAFADHLERIAGAGAGLA